MKIKTIDVNAKEWFDKINGNSYFSATVSINFGMASQINLKLPFQYGYGSHYEHEAFQELIKKGYIKDYNYSYHTPHWQYYRDNNIIYRHSKQENCLKRELIK